MGSLPAWASLMIFAGVAAAAPVPVPPKTVAGEPPLSAMKLLKHRKVQKELRLSAEQRIAILDGLADLEEDHAKKQQMLLKTPNPTEEPFLKLEKETREANDKFLKATTMKVLSPPQRTRLKQIDRQIRGAAVFSDEELEKILSLTEKQKKIIAKAAEELEEKIDAFIEKLGNDDSDNAKEELLKLRQDSTKALTAMLNADQRDTWKLLLGEPVKGLDPVELWFAILEEDENMLLP